MNKIFPFVLLTIILISCGGNGSETNETDETIVDVYTPLPYIGLHDIDLEDTIYHTVPPFQLIDQDSNQFSNADVEGKVHVANFFFTSCPSICPAMIEQMKRLQEMTNDIDELIILSHTIDPERDTLPKLRKYIADRNIDTHNWHFLWGDREYIHWLGEEGYMINAMEDEQAEGGFLHSEHFVLIDREGHIRGLYTGTDTEEVNKLNEDIRKLIKNEYN
ncbi:MAG: SCO family protein [Crocinitomicaceae bacterium]|nr:SCO family protein [Crocinitomicaceae bacterium]